MGCGSSIVEPHARNFAPPVALTSRIDDGEPDRKPEQAACRSRSVLPDASSERADRVRSLTRKASLKATNRGRDASGSIHTPLPGPYVDALVNRWLTSKPLLVIWDWDRTVVACHTFNEGVEPDAVRPIACATRRLEMCCSPRIRLATSSGGRAMVHRCLRPGALPTFCADISRAGHCHRHRFLRKARCDQ